MPITTGQATVGTTPAVQIITVSPKITKGVTVKALSTNSGIIWLGITGVLATTGFELTAGESFTLPINDDVTDLEELTIFIIGSAASQKICYLTF